MSIFCERRTCGTINASSVFAAGGIMRWSLMMLTFLALLWMFVTGPVYTADPPVALINEFMPAPASGPEWVEIVNRGDTPLDVSGWRIDDDTPGGPQTIIPSGTIIPPYSLLVVELKTYILNNSGTDAATLLDTSGVPVDVAPYTSATVGKSFARIPDAGAVWVRSDPSPGQWNMPPGLSSLTPSPSPADTASLTVTPDGIPEHTPSPEPTTPVTGTDTPLPSMPSDTSTAIGEPAITQTSQPTATDEPMPTRTPSPTHTPSSTDDPTATNEPTATRTPSPTRTLSPTRTPSPTDDPTATDEPTPTRTPLPTRT
ncbi:MAG: lamin tail domain-containing protein, partial [Roseiflexus sp.]|nr:lamin tail domain-containing protein [Roseiflexus sp.]